MSTKRYFGNGTLNHKIKNKKLSKEYHFEEFYDITFINCDFTEFFSLKINDAKNIIFKNTRINGSIDCKATKISFINCKLNETKSCKFDCEELTVSGCNVSSYFNIGSNDEL